MPAYWRIFFQSTNKCPFLRNIKGNREREASPVRINTKGPSGIDINFPKMAVNPKRNTAMCNSRKALRMACKNKAYGGFYLC
jgi:hypothetical protein